MRPSLPTVALGFFLFLSSCTSAWKEVGASSARFLVPDRMTMKYGEGRGRTDGGDPRWDSSGDASWWEAGLEWDIGPQEIRIVGDRRAMLDDALGPVKPAWYESERPTLSIGGVDVRAEEGDGGALWVKLPAAFVTLIVMAGLAALGFQRYRAKRADP